MFSPTLFILNLNLAISSWSEWQSAPSLVFADCIELFIYLFIYLFSIFSCKKYSLSDFSVDYLVMSMCRVISCVGRECLLWPVHSLDNSLLDFALHHSVLQGQTCLLLRISLDFLLLNSSPLWWKGQLFVCVCVLVLEDLLGLLRTIQLHILWQ